MPKYLHLSDFFRTFASSKVNEQQNLTNMEATLRQAVYDFEIGVMERPLIDPDWAVKPSYSHQEFWNEAYSDLGKRYGLNDIREAK